MALRFSLLVIALSASTLEAQSYWNDDRERQQSRVEFLRPLIPHGHLKPLSGALFLGLSGRIGSNARPPWRSAEGSSPPRREAA